MWPEVEKAPDRYNQLRWGHTRTGGPLTWYNWCPSKKGHRHAHAHRESPHGHRQRSWADMWISQRYIRPIAKVQREAWDRFHLPPPGATSLRSPASDSESEHPGTAAPSLILCRWLGVQQQILPVSSIHSTNLLLFSCSIASDSLRDLTSQASLSFTISQSLLKLVSIESVMPSKHLILYHPLFLPPSIFPSIKVFSNESPLCIRWPKYWSFSFRVSPSNEYSEFISFRIDGMDLLAVQGTLKGLPQHHILKASVFQCSAFFMV